MSVYRTPFFVLLMIAWGGVVAPCFEPASAPRAARVGGALVGETAEELLLQLQHAHRVGPQCRRGAAEHGAVAGVVQVAQFPAKVVVGQSFRWNALCHWFPLALPIMPRRGVTGEGERAGTGSRGADRK